jgi:hypothetical protein
LGGGLNKNTVLVFQQTGDLKNKTAEELKKFTPEMLHRNSENLISSIFGSVKVR